jgi:alkanesulfonate monooxygenase SsuD/methylene tetrahydromethanopterin reductase-like flavin-dependent oxidoreductase (luciferase family)
VRIGVGLPTSTPGADGTLMVEWARRAEALGFSSLGTVDRVVYDCWEPLLALAGAAAVTDRVRLVTMILIGPLRATPLLAKQAATLDSLSGGRLVLGLGIGARHDDYEAVGVDPGTRGRDLSVQLVGLRDGWEEAGFSPRAVTPGGPTLLVGGAGGAAFARMARSSDGYAHGGGPPRAFAAAASRARAAWADAGRPGRPQLWGQGYWARGDAADVERGAAYLRSYYAFTGGFEERIAAGNLTSPQAVRSFVRGYEEEGCDELVLLPTLSSLTQLELLAEVLGDLLEPRPHPGPPLKGREAEL